MTRGKTPKHRVYSFCMARHSPKRLLPIFLQPSEITKRLTPPLNLHFRLFHWAEPYVYTVPNRPQISYKRKRWWMRGLCIAKSCPSNKTFNLEQSTQRRPSSYTTSQQTSISTHTHSRPTWWNARPTYSSSSTNTILCSSSLHSRRHSHCSSNR